MGPHRVGDRRIRQRAGSRQVATTLRDAEALAGAKLADDKSGIMKQIKRMFLARFNRLGYKIERIKPASETYVEMEQEFFDIYYKYRPFAGSGIERAYSLYKAIRYVVEHEVPGSIVECGVWMGGSIVLAALALQQLGDTSRELYLYDTFKGMPEPSARDVDCWNHAA